MKNDRKFRWVLPALWVYAFALAFYTNWRYIDRPFDFQIPGGYTDDRYYLGYGPLTWQRPFTDWLPSSGTMFYRPVFSIWFSGLHRVFGLWSPGFQIADICLHAVAVGLAASLAIRLSRQWWAGFIVATIMALSGTIYASAVYWASCSATLLAAIWSLAMLHAWMSWRQTGQRKFYWGALICAVLAIGSKQDAAGVPFLIPVLDWILQDKRFAWREYALFVLPLFLNLLSNAGGVGSYSKTASTLTLWERFQAPFEYLERCTFGLLSFHAAPLNLVPLVISLTILCYPIVTQRNSRSGKLAIMGCAMFSLFAGTIGLATGMAMPDRYFYLPMLAACLFLAVFPWLLWHGEKGGRMAFIALACRIVSIYLPTPRDPFGVLGLVVVTLLFAVLAVRESWISWKTAVLVVVVAVAPQTEIYFSIGNAGTFPLWNIVALTVVLLANKNGERFYPLAATWLLLTSPSTVLPAFLLAVSIMPVLRMRKNQHRNLILGEPVLAHQVRESV